ncbi:hypothetical protein [Streptomyces sp. CS62]
MITFTYTCGPAAGTPSETEAAQAFRGKPGLSRVERSRHTYGAYRLLR